MIRLYQFNIRPRARYGCQVLSQHPQDGGFPLATITLPDVRGYVHPHGWLVVALGMGPMRQSSAT